MRPSDLIIFLLSEVSVKSREGHLAAYVQKHLIDLRNEANQIPSGQVNLQILLTASFQHPATNLTM